MPQRILDYQLILAATQEQSDRGLVVRMPQQIVGGGKIEIQLTDERRIEGNGLEFNHDIAAQLQVVEQ